MENRSISQSEQIEDNQAPRYLRRTQFMPNYLGESGEVNTLPSQTIPDQSLSVRQLMERAARGTLGDVTNHGEAYYDDLEIRHDMDLVELHERREELNNRIKQLQDETKEDTGSGSNVDSDSSSDSGERGKGETDTSESEQQ